MKQVFQLKIQIGDINSDLYFEEKEVAEYAFDFLMKMLTDEAKKKIKIEANFHEINTKDMITEYFLGIMGLTVDDIKC